MNVNKEELRAKRREEARKRRLRALTNNMDFCVNAGDFPGPKLHETTEYRLRQVFGVPYCNAYLKKQVLKPYFSSNAIIHSKLNLLDANNAAIDANAEDLIQRMNLFNINQMSLLSPRNIALNSYNGWYAMIMYDLASELPYLCIFEAVDSFGFRLLCYVSVADLFVEKVMFSNSEFQRIKNKQELKDILRMTRIRFVDGNNVFIFVWHSPKSQVYQYKVKLTENYAKLNIKRNENKEGTITTKKNNNNNTNKNRARLILFNEFQDDYITKAQTNDGEIICNPDILAIMFGKWIGFYRIDMNDAKCKLEWFHVTLIVFVFYSCLPFVF